MRYVLLINLAPSRRRSATKNEAIEWAKKIPLREDPNVEIRPIWPK
jgi:hypothetical protein